MIIIRRVESGQIVATLLASLLLSSSFFFTGLVQPVDAQSSIPDSMGPGAGTILIHQYNDEYQEAQAFESGLIDLMDWPPPKQFVDAWTGTDPSRNIITQGRAFLHKTVEIGTFQIDINSFAWPTNDVSLRRALGYLLDRQTITLSIGGGNLVSLCAGGSHGQPGFKSCVQLGYPTVYGDFDPSKALQVLYEGGWRDTNNNGILEATNGTEPTLTFYIRADHTFRREAGKLFANQVRNLPNGFRDKSTGATVEVCSTTTCGISVQEFVLRRAQIVPIVLRGVACPYSIPVSQCNQDSWRDWHLYTGGWGLGLEPDQYAYLYGSDFAPRGCGGGWPQFNPLNYPCYVDPTFDNLTRPIINGPTYDDVIAASRAAQDYAWGYSGGKITGTMPTVPLYNFLHDNVGWLSDQGDLPKLNPDGSRACWKGFNDQEVGWGLGVLQENLVGLTLDNCQDGAAYVSYRGQGTIDWGFKTTIDRLNIVASVWLWDLLAMQQTYEACLKRSPVDLAVYVPVLCESFGESTYFNSLLGRQATVAVYEFRDGVRWSDFDTSSRYMTALDFKFSAEYVLCNNGLNSSNLLLYSIFDSDYDPCNGVTGIVVTGADPANGLGGTAHLYFDDLNVLFMRYTGPLPIIPQHVWCASWPDTTQDCAYPYADFFPDFDFSKHVGTGPYLISSCTGPGCTETITLTPNPYYGDGTRYWNLPAHISLQPDLNRDDLVDQTDLDLLSKADQNDPRFDVDHRITDKETVQVTNAFGPGVFNVTLRGTRIDMIDRYIVERLVFEGQVQGWSVVWPPSRGRLTYVWPDIDRDNDVDLDDLIGVYLNQFQPVEPVSSRSINDVDYDRDIDLDDLILTFVREFSRPVGVVK